MLIERNVPLEVRNSYGGTVLRSAIHGVEYQPKVDHLAIIEALLTAGANVDEADFPTENAFVDDVLRRHCAKS
jgi:hypothetical protein